MIKFFRKIRRRLLDGNNFKKYALYALGEIILVVLGILIALKINNMNEARKTNMVKTQYLISLKEEFKQNLVEADRVLALCENIYQASVTLAANTGPDASNLTEEMASKEVMATFSHPPKYVASPGILNELISSGNLSQIESPELRKSLQKWLVLKQETQDEEDELWKHRFEAMDILNQKISFRRLLKEAGVVKIVTATDNDTRFETDNTEFLRDRYFENVLLFYTIVVKALQNDFYPKLRENIVSILAEIEKQLAK